MNRRSLFQRLLGAAAAAKAGEAQSEPVRAKAAATLTGFVQPDDNHLYYLGADLQMRSMTTQPSGSKCAPYRQS